MGLLKTVWEAEFKGHVIAVVRGLGGTSFKLYIDDELVDASASGGSGDSHQLHALLEHEGEEYRILVTGDDQGYRKSATVLVNATELSLKQVK